MIPNIPAEVHAFNKALAAMGESERYWRLQKLEALWNGQRYKIENRPSFWDQKVPLRQRAPYIQSHLPRIAGTRLASLVFGERTFPSMTVTGGGYGAPLTPADVELLQALLVEVIKASKLSLRAHDYLLEGLKTGTSVCLQSLKNGRPCIKILPAKWCTPTLDGNGKVTAMVIQYKVASPVPGMFQWYRRELANGFDRVWESCPVEKEEPDWSKMPLLSEDPIEFVPVVWTRSQPEGVDQEGEIDGHALAEGLEDEIEALDMELSQLVRNAFYNGDPQMVRTQNQDADPAPMAPMAEQGFLAAAFSWLDSRGSGNSGSQGPANKKGPGQIWNLPPGGDAKLLESNGSGAKIIEAAMNQIRRILTDNLGVVLVDPETMGRGDISARALSLLHAPMIDTCDNLRDTYGDAMVEILGQLLRLCAGPQAAEGGVHLGAWEDARAALAKLWARRSDDTMVWINPTVEIRWGDIFAQSWGEVSAAVEAASKGVAGKVLSQRRAVSMLAKMTGVTDIEEEMALLQGAPSPEEGT